MSKGGRITVAIALGFLAAMFGMLYLMSQRDEILGASEVVRVYVAADDLKPNVPLERSMLTVRQIPKAFVQPTAITVTEVPEVDKVTGVPIVPIREGEQIIRTKLFEGSTPPLSADLKGRPGMVGVGIEVKAFQNAVHGLLTPGDRVDVLASFEFEKSKDETFKEVRPLYQNIEVLAVNDKTRGNTRVQATAQKGAPESSVTRELKTVTLSLPPAAAQQVVLAQQLGEVWLLLRAPGDTAPHQYEIWNNDRLLKSPYRLWRTRSQDEMLREALMNR